MSCICTVHMIEYVPPYLLINCVKIASERICICICNLHIYVVMYVPYLCSCPMLPISKRKRKAEFQLMPVPKKKRYVAIPVNYVHTCHTIPIGTTPLSGNKILWKGPGDKAKAGKTNKR